MNDDDNFIHKYYPLFYHQRTMKMYLLNENIIQLNEESVIIKTLSWIST